MTASPAPREELRADCGACVGLCCVALPFARSADFAFDKPGGMPCPHLRTDDRCAVHATLRREGFAGCDAFDCFGAGQQVTQVTFRGASWRDGAATAEAMFAAFDVVRAVHEMRWYVADASTRALSAELSAEVAAAWAWLSDLAAGSAGELAAADVPGTRSGVADLLGRVSAVVRDGLAGPSLRGRDLSARSYRAVSWQGADLRGALVTGTDLSGADLRTADLLGADLRGADLTGADLGDALFVTSPQLAAARGDEATRIPDHLARPAHWSVGSIALSKRI